MPSYNLGELKLSFQAIKRVEIIERLQRSVESDDDIYAKTFLATMDGIVRSARDNKDLIQQFTITCEQQICSGSQRSVNCDLVRVVPLSKFLPYYSRTFIEIELDSPELSRLLQAESRKLQTIIRTVNMRDENTRYYFINKVLNLNGHLRRLGYALWLTTTEEVKDCSTYEDYVKRLALDERAPPPALRFDISYRNLESIPNIRHGEPAHDPSDTMTIHEPTIVDGMHFDTFVRGGATAGGALEYVSKLDNTDAIDYLEIIK